VLKNFSSSLLNEDKSLRKSLKFQFSYGLHRIRSCNKDSVLSIDILMKFYIIFTVFFFFCLYVFGIFWCFLALGVPLSKKMTKKFEKKSIYVVEKH